MKVGVFLILTIMPCAALAQASVVDEAKALAGAAQSDSESSYGSHLSEAMELHNSIDTLSSRTMPFSEALTLFEDKSDILNRFVSYSEFNDLIVKKRVSNELLAMSDMKTVMHNYLNECSFSVGNSDQGRTYVERSLEIRFNQQYWSSMKFTGNVDDNDRMWVKAFCPSR